jgi:hypothetical protein
MIPIVPVFFGPNMKAFTAPLSAFCNVRSTSSRGNETPAFTPINWPFSSKNG